MEDTKVGMAAKHGHKCVNVLSIIVLCGSFVLTAIFNALAGSGTPALFNSGTGNISDKYELDVTPAGWTFSIWGIIYCAIALTLAFFVVSIFKKNQHGYIYLCPIVVSPAFCAIYSLNFLLNLGWIFLWDRELLVVSSYFLFVIAITNIISMSVLVQNIEQDNHRLKHEQPITYWIYVVLASNGQALYGTWTVIASLLNLTHCLVYRDNVDMQAAVIVNLSLLLIIALGWAFTEWIFLDAFTRFLVTPYLVVIWALSGILSKKNSDPQVSDLTKNFLRGLMAVAVVLLLVKITLLIIRQIKKPFQRLTLA